MLGKTFAPALRPATCNAVFLRSWSQPGSQPTPGFGTTLSRPQLHGLPAPTVCMAGEGTGRQQQQPQPSRGSTAMQATKSRGNGLWALGQGLEGSTWHSPPSTNKRLLLAGGLVAVSTALVARQAMLQLLSGVPGTFAPLTSTIVATVAVGWEAYNYQLSVHPVATKIMTSLVGCFIGDLIAQVLTYVMAKRDYNKKYQNSRAHSHSHSHHSVDGAAWDQQAAAATNGATLHEESHSHALPAPPQFHYDAGRISRLMLYSIMTAPWYQFWFLLLDQIVLPGAPNTPQAVLGKVALDQLVMAPTLTAFFFIAMKVMEDVPAMGVSKPKVLLQRGIESMKSKLLPTMKANYAVWPLAHVINFALIPPPLRILYCTAVSIAWTVFICLMLSGGQNQEEDKSEEQAKVASKPVAVSSYAESS